MLTEEYTIIFNLRKSCYFTDYRLLNENFTVLCKKSSSLILLNKTK